MKVSWLKWSRHPIWRRCILLVVYDEITWNQWDNNHEILMNLHRGFFSGEIVLRSSGSRRDYDVPLFFFQVCLTMKIKNPTLFPCYSLCYVVALSLEGYRCLLVWLLIFYNMLNKRVWPRSHFIVNQGLTSNSSHHQMYIPPALYRKSVFIRLHDLDYSGLEL